MIILAVDTDAYNLRVLTGALNRVFPAHAVVPFRDPLMAFPFAMNNRVEMAFIALRMPRASGSETAGVLRRFNPRINVCVMGQGTQDERLARQQGFYAYAQKPVTESRLRRALDNGDRFARRRADLLANNYYWEVRS